MIAQKRRRSWSGPYVSGVRPCIRASSWLLRASAPAARPIAAIRMKPDTHSRQSSSSGNCPIMKIRSVSRMIVKSIETIQAIAFQAR